MGDSANNQQQGSQVYYDAGSGQYYTQNTSPKYSNGLEALFGTLVSNPNNNNRTYLNNFGNNNNNALINARIAAANNPQVSSPIDMFTAPANIESLLSNNSGSSGAGRFLAPASSSTASNNSK